MTEALAGREYQEWGVAEPFRADLADLALGIRAKAAS